MKNQTFEKLHIGNEPIIVKDTSDLVEVLNWYNYSCNEETAKKYIIQYMKKKSYTKEAIESFDSISTYQVPTTAAWLCRIVNNGNELDTKLTSYIKSKISERMPTAKSSAEDTPKKVVNIQDRIKSSSNIYISDIEVMIDTVIVDNSKQIDVYSYLLGKDVSPQVCGYIKEFFQTRLDEISTDDEQIIEGYGDQRDMWIQFYTNLLGNIENYVNNKKKTKVSKPRAKKERLVTEVVKKLQVLKQFPEMKLVSINPTDIVGAEQLWVYNTNYKTITLYQTNTHSGLSVKGTTITNFDENASITKKLRKPEIGVKSVLEGGKITLRKFLDSLTTKPQTTTGRINQHTILLRVTK
jgi:hypothetical protein